MISKSLAEFYFHTLHVQQCYIYILLKEIKLCVKIVLHFMLEYFMKMMIVSIFYVGVNSLMLAL